MDYSRQTTSWAEWLRQLIGITKERTLAGVTACSGVPLMTRGTEIMNSLPKSRRALPEICVRDLAHEVAHVVVRHLGLAQLINSTVSIGREAVKYTMPLRCRQW